jgi:hypothetical protein
MCGRTVVARSLGELVTLFDIDDVIGEQPGITYNNPPSLPASIIVDRVLKDNEGEHAGELRRQLHSEDQECCSQATLCDACLRLLRMADKRRWF